MSGSTAVCRRSSRNRLIAVGFRLSCTTAALGDRPPPGQLPHTALRRTVSRIASAIVRRSAKTAGRADTFLRLVLGCERRRGCCRTPIQCLVAPRILGRPTCPRTGCRRFSVRQLTPLWRVFTALGHDAISFQRSPGPPLRRPLGNVPPKPRSQLPGPSQDGPWRVVAVGPRRRVREPPRRPRHDRVARPEGTPKPQR